MALSTIPLRFFRAVLLGEQRPSIEDRPLRQPLAVLKRKIGTRSS